MKITLLTADLTKALSIANRFVSHKGQLPILANILISASGQGVTLSATNLEVGIRLTIAGKVTEDGDITTPARNFTEFIATIGEAQIELVATENKLKVSSGKFKADFPTIAATEFPVIPKIDAQPKVDLDANLVTQLATQVAFSCAVDESRPVLTGIKLSVLDGNLLAVGTDGFRLSKKLLGDTKKMTISKDMVIPARTILELAKILGDTNQDGLALVTLPENNQVVFITSRMELFSRVLEGNFPDVDKIIPKTFINQVVVDRSEFSRGLRAAAIFARENNNLIKFQVSSSKLVIKATSTSSGETSLEFEADTEGAGEVTFNYKYVTDFISSVTSDRVIMQFNESTNPVQFGADEDASYLHVIMPIRI